MWTGQSDLLNGPERLDLLGLRALGPPAGRVLARWFLKAAVTVSLDGGVVKTSSVPSSGAMEPYPLSALNHFTVP
jgi:hypothetical protein